MPAFVRSWASLFVMIAFSVLLQASAVSGIAWLSFFSYVDIPLSMVRVYFHEMGHGLAALLTGGHFYQIELAFGQGGLAHMDGAGLSGDRIALFCGYLAPSIWGLVIYLAFTQWLADRIEWVPYFCMGIAGVSLLLWARDIRTIGIIVFIMAVFQSIGRLESDRQLCWAIKFISIYLIVGGGLDPYLFFNFPEYSTPEMMAVWDGKGLSDLTRHAESFWVHCWMAASGAALLVVLVLEFFEGEHVWA